MNDAVCLSVRPIQKRMRIPYRNFNDNILHRACLTDTPFSGRKVKGQVVRAG